MAIRKNLNSKLLHIIDIILPYASLIIFNRIVISIFQLYPAMSFKDIFYWQDIIEISITMILISWSLSRQFLFADFKRRLFRSKSIIVFMIYSISSLFWTSNFPSTSYRLYIFVFTLITANYFLTRFTPKEIRNILLRFAAIILVLNFLMALLNPHIGIRPDSIYSGSWFGILWHKNHMGIVSALFYLLYLYELIFVKILEKKFSAFLSAFTFLNLVLVFLSRSATAIILVLMVSLIMILIMIWLRLEAKLTKSHYILIFTSILIISIISFTNLEFILGLFGKSTTLTGRVPMWKYLIANIVSQHPISGIGFGALWNNELFRIETAQNIGWSYQVVFADNGYLDVILNQGYIGITLFLWIMFDLLKKSVKYALLQKDFLAFMPLVVSIFILVGNISYSMFFEVETFFWFIFLVFSGFATLENIKD